VTYTREWEPAATGLIPTDLHGLSVLDLACGWGQLSRIMAGRGAQVTGVDQSARMLDRARRIELAAPQGIRYLEGDATELQWWDREPYDGVVCNMALMDIDDLDAAMATAAAVMKPSGWYVFSLLHPCFPGRPGDPASRPSWPDDGYATEGWWTTGENGVRGHVGAHHRMLATYLNAAVGAGLVFEQFFEGTSEVPELFAARCRLPA
jgi:2-polyprenyl-3-methyl-5-hydroxy-6-metoxy-1,4-benzoquinol methylase